MSSLVASRSLTRRHIDYGFILQRVAAHAALIILGLI